MILALLAGCGSPPAASDPSTSPETSGATAGTSEPEGKDGASPAGPEAAVSPEAGKEGGAKAQAAPEGEASEAMTLARDFLKTGGRRVGYSATKKAFAYPVEHRAERGFGLDVQFAGDDGRPRDMMRICQIGECEEHLDEIMKEMLPKLASRLEQDGYVSVRGIGWPQGRDELEVNSLTMKLKYTKGKLESVREGKPAARLTLLGGKRLDAPTLLAIFVIPDTQLLGVFAAPSGDAKGMVQDFYVFKLP
jgi:hypothetical protein